MMKSLGSKKTRQRSLIVVGATLLWLFNNQSDQTLVPSSDVRTSSTSQQQKQNKNQTKLASTVRVSTTTTATPEQETGPLCFALPSDAIAGAGGTNMNTSAGASGQGENPPRIAEPALRPTLGYHRPDQDAVFAMAAGYPLETVSQFVGLLLATGFDGDIVLGMQPLQSCEETLRDYLTWHSEHSHVVVYEVKARCRGRKRCILNGLYKYSNSTDTLPDPRKLRFLDRMRYELYWIWSLVYAKGEGNTQSRILLIDSRDVYFQSNPFTYEKDETDVTSTLHVYEEIETIGSQRNNRLWIFDAYGADSLAQVANFTILCSGSTLGGAAAIELYSRAMVEENDKDATCWIRGCDQGHHNYLVHSRKLLECRNNKQDAHRIQTIKTHAVGEGAILTAGSMLAKRTHTELIVRNGTEFEFYNKNGMLAPVVHQIDRNATIFAMVAQRAKAELELWKTKRYGGNSSNKDV